MIIKTIIALAVAGLVYWGIESLLEKILVKLAPSKKVDLKNKKRTQAVMIYDLVLAFLCPLIALIPYALTLKNMLIYFANPAAEKLTIIFTLILAAVGVLKNIVAIIMIAKS